MLPFCQTMWYNRDIYNKKATLSGDFFDRLRFKTESDSSFLFRRLYYHCRQIAAIQLDRPIKPGIALFWQAF